MRARRWSARDLAERLAENAAALVAELLPGGRREGGYFKAGSTSGGPGRNRGSLVVNLTGPRRGQWRDWSAGEHGDLLDLVGAARGLSFPDACRFAERWLGLPGAAGRWPLHDGLDREKEGGSHGVPGVPGPGICRRGKVASLASPATGCSQDAVSGDDATKPGSVTSGRGSVQGKQADRFWTTEKVLAELWRPAKPIVGTPAERYLLDARGFPLANWPACLRFRPALEYPKSRRFFPALVALASAPDGRPTAVQVTYLDPARPGKAPVKSSRLTFGPLQGGAVRLADPDGARLAIAEGTEKALAVMLAGWPCWAALGGNLPGVILPAGVRDVLIAADNDAHGKGLEMARKLARRLQREGRMVRVVWPKDVKDWDSYLLVGRMGVGQ